MHYLVESLRLRGKASFGKGAVAPRKKGYGVFFAEERSECRSVLAGAARKCWELSRTPTLAVVAVGEHRAPNPHTPLGPHSPASPLPSPLPGLSYPLQAKTSGKPPILLQSINGPGLLATPTSSNKCRCANNRAVLELLADGAQRQIDADPGGAVA